MTLLRQILLGLALIAAVVGYVGFTHHALADAEQRANAAETVANDLRGELEAQKHSEHIVTQYVDRVQIIHEQGATLTKEIPVYVSAQADAACTVPLGFVRLHDVAAQSAPLPSPAGAADAAPSWLPLSAVAGTVVDNYTTCHATAAQLTALQAWVRANAP